MNYFRCGGGRSTHTASQITVAKTPLATFESNVSGLYIPEILAYITATQSGTGDPSPSNPRAINGVSSVDTTVCGKNLFNGTNVINGAFDAYGKVVSTSAGKIVYVRCKPNATYTVSKTAGKRFAITYSTTIPYVGLECSGYTANNTASSITITTGADAKYICAYVYHSSYDSGSAEDMLSSVQIEESNTATAYEPYTGTTATTALGDTYYGGYVNVTTGLLTIDMVQIDLGSLNWTYRSGNKLFTAFKSGIKLSSDAKGTHCLCDIYKETYGGSWSGWANFPNEHISSGNNYSSGDANIAVKDLRYTDKDTFKTAMNGVKLVYTLATPQTVQLTPAQLEQLLGENNVFCSSGDVAVKYWKID